ncbi:hypothetical protein ACJRO7_005918 [Eucalyptus globulus]|uniref:Myb/SANT-like domain-containing protein n=1 Tax=Eucalyptus globulus TaxID=34317 RepID=A0ABD3J493_EUCGL
MAPHKEAFIAKWTKSLTNVLISLLVEEVKKGNRPTCTYNKVGWNNIHVEFNKQTELHYNVVQLKNRVNKLKKQYSSFKKLFSQSGFGWDNVNKTVTVEESSVWDSHIKDNIEWAKFKNDGFPQYPDFCIVFGDTYATGAYTTGNAEENAEEYVVSDEEDNGVSGDNGGGDTIGDAEESNENDVDTGVLASDATPTLVREKHKLNRTPNSKRRRKSNNHELGVTMKAIQEMIKSRTAKSTSDSITSEALPPVAPPPVDPYSIAVVVAVLNDMSDLEHNLYNKAVNQACLNATWREAFMVALPERRRGLIESLE